MPEPFRLRVQQALADYLKTEITTANGYQHDLGPDVPGGAPQGRVFRGRLVFGESDPLPMLSILEVPLPQEDFRTQEDNTARSAIYELIVQGFVTDDPINPTDPGHRLMADVKKALAKQILKFSRQGGYAFDMRELTKLVIGQGVVRPPDEVSAKAYFWLGLGIHMVEDLNDPYA